MTRQIALTSPANAALTLSVSDVLVDLGGISPERLRSSGGTATIDDLAIAHAQGNFCELVDGLLVEKAMGFRESLLALFLGHVLLKHVSEKKGGLVSGPDGFITLFPNFVRGPDVAYISWDRLPNRRLPEEAYPSIVPELVVEILSVGNTRAEMARKRREYFQAGVQLVWMVDPRERSVAVFTSPIDFVVRLDDETLDGGNVLPEFSVSLAEFFAVLDAPDPEK